MHNKTTRRTVLATLGVAAGTAFFGSTSNAKANAAASATSLLPDGSADLRELARRLAQAPRRRSFKTAPMILEHPDQWDHEALSELIAYRGSRRQLWENTDLTGPWLKLMRNGLNTQIWSFRHPDFLVVSATHGSAHLAMFDQATWDKYDLAKLTDGKFTRNSLIVEEPAVSANVGDLGNPSGSSLVRVATIPALQRRGAVFLCCHNAIWETAEKLIAASVNPDKLPVEALAAELTNHVIPGAIVTPGVVATMVELQQAGFQYAR